MLGCPTWQVLALVACCLLLAAGSGQALTLYVAPSGKDAWSGKLAAPSRDQGDGPLATLVGARDALRRLRAAGQLTAPVQVVIQPGTYRLAEPLVLEPQDSGTADCPITYTGLPGREPVLSGGRPITGWRRQGKLWVADLPEVREGKWYFEALWVNGRRRVRARTPNQGYFYTDGKALPVTDPATGQEVSRERTAFRFEPGSFQPWQNLEDAQVVVYHAWETSLLRIQSLDLASRTVVFTGPAAWPFESWGPNQRFHVENIFEALDAPGEWYLNRKTGRLYYLPFPREALRRAQVVAPVARQLVVLAGHPEQGQFVQHVHFAHLRLLHTGELTEPQGHSDSQAAHSVPATWQAVGARHCSLECCEIAHTGNYAAWLRQGCQDNRIFHCHLHDLGAGGVRIGETGDPASESQAALRNVVDNSFIHDGGKIFRGAVGVWIGRASRNSVTRNDICDLDYTGISVGWSWGYAPSSANHNVLEYNHIHNIGRGVLSDLGGIYTLGISPGTRERYNLMHDIYCYQYGGWGVYTDEGSSEILIENNIVYNTSTGGFHQHYGQENRVHNNIFAFARLGQLQRSREEEHISFFFERNLVITRGEPFHHAGWKNGWYRIDRNLYWDYANPKPDFYRMPLAEWQAQGRDQHSLVADPLFVDAQAYDFRLRPGSPALGLGWRPIATSRIGLYGEKSWVELPRRLAQPPFGPQPVPPQPISDDFESTAVGARAGRGAVTAEEGPATVRATEETAASGRRSLKFTDAPGLEHSYNPHLYYAPHYSSGVAEASFDLRVEPGMLMYHEWRDAYSPYRVGPSFTINAQGDLLVADRVIVCLVPGRWYRFRISCGLGQQANGAWRLALTSPRGGRPRQFNLDCDPDFQALAWVGWVAQGEGQGVFYLDNVRLVPGK